MALPAGRDWYDFRTGSRFRGGRVARVATPLATHPIFVRAGAILPLAPVSDRTGSLARTIELRIHAGHDGSFVLYDDEGDGAGHLHGEFMKIPLSIGAMPRRPSRSVSGSGSSGMHKMQGFEVTVVDGTDVRRRSVVSYSGTMQRVVIERAAGVAGVRPAPRDQSKSRPRASTRANAAVSP